MRKVPVFLPYFDNTEEELIIQTLHSGWVAQGAKVEEFEKQVAEYEKVRYAVATSSCTTALHLAMVGMGLSKEHDILIPSYTFVATANTAEFTGATPILVDVRTDTYCIDMEFLQRFIENNYKRVNNVMKNKETGKTLFGVVPVGLFGICADIPKINELAKHYNLKVLEDNACALGASIGGIHEGAFGNPSCLSFHARKSITTGEGGMILTDDEKLAKKLYKLRSHSAAASEISRHQNHGFLMPEYNELGYNYRMTDIQGAMGVAQMNKFEQILNKKRAKAKRYDSLLPQEVPYLIPPTAPKDFSHTYQSYVIMVDYLSLGLRTVEEGHLFRNRLMEFLEENDISTRQGTHAIHTLGYYKKRYKYQESDLPGANMCDKLSIAIPLYVGLSDKDQDYVVDKLSEGIKTIFK